jgi:ABC-type multidrug transport system fused ATPase/permease subunit
LYIEKNKEMKEEEVNYFKDTKDKVKQHLQQRIMLLRLQATEKISTIASTIITVVVVAVIAVFLLIFISITAGYWLADVTGSLTAGFGIVALFYLVVFLFVAFFLRKILQNFFINKFIHLFHKKD